MLNALKKGFAVNHGLWVFIICLFSSSASAVPLSPADRNTSSNYLRKTGASVKSLSVAWCCLSVTEPETPPATRGPCFVISRIEIDGATRLSRTAADRLTAPWLNQFLDMARLTQLTSRITDWYISRGFITSRAFLTEQDLSSGVLHIAMLEGKRQAIRLEGVPDRTLNMTFPGLEGNILNLRDIEQGMEQLNRVRQTPVEIEILPGDRQGYSVVNLTATPEFPLSGSVSFDNSGQKSTGQSSVSKPCAGCYGLPAAAGMPGVCAAISPVRVNSSGSSVMLLSLRDSLRQNSVMVRLV